MSAAPDHDEHSPHEGPIKTPKQLVVAVILAFVVPITIIVLLAQYVSSGAKPAAGSEGLAAKATEQRIAPVAAVQVKDAADTAPKFGDAAAWAPRITAGYDALLTSALKGKGAMAAQGGGDLSDLEIGRAVVHLANAGGAKFEEPKAAAPAASAASN
jgi:cytochrome c5